MSNGNGKKSVMKFPTHCERPLVRCGDVVYCGNMKDKHVVKLEIKNKKRMLDMDVVDRVGIQLVYTSLDIRACRQIIKSSEREGLYLAMDIADAWL